MNKHTTHNPPQVGGDGGKVFIGTVGYHNLCNHSIGPALLLQLQKMNWAPGVDVDELNWGPIAIVQKFQSFPTAYDRIILLSADRKSVV